MTTVVWLNGELAGDTQVTAGTLIDSPISKVECITPFTLFGFSGNIDLKKAFMDWVIEGANRRKQPFCFSRRNDFEAIVVHRVKDGTVFNVYSNNFTATTYSNLPFYVIGSGSQLAFGAYEAVKALGKVNETRARDIVKWVSNRDIYTNNKIESVKFREIKKEQA